MLWDMGFQVTSIVLDFLTVHIYGGRRRLHHGCFDSSGQYNRSNNIYHKQRERRIVLVEWAEIPKPDCIDASLDSSGYIMWHRGDMESFTGWVLSAEFLCNAIGIRDPTLVAFASIGT